MKFKEQFYLVLSGIFIASLVTCNLIANKFVSVQTILREEPFILSAGILPYPVTFLITDLLSEFYGRKRTAIVVFTGFVASILIIIVLNLGAVFDAIEESPVSNEMYASVFGNSWRVIGASMLAYIIAQLVDVQLYEFWKKRTKGKMLWLRNNGSTMVSQFVDTVTVTFVFLYGNEAVFAGSTEQLWTMVAQVYLIKMAIAVVDTPFCYAGVWLLRKIS